MAASGYSRRGKIAFILILLAAGALFAIIGYAFGGESMLHSLLNQTLNVDEEGYLSDYDARIGWYYFGTPTMEEQVALDAPPQEKDSAATNKSLTIPPSRPLKPGSAR